MLRRCPLTVYEVGSSALALAFIIIHVGTFFGDKIRLRPIFAMRNCIISERNGPDPDLV